VIAGSTPTKGKLVSSVRILGTALSLFLFLAQPSFAQQKRWVVFRDKGPGSATFKPGEPLFNAALQTLTNKALTRRSVARPHLNVIELITLEDAPVFQGYVDSLVTLGADVRSISRWSNAVSVSADESTFSAIRRLPFISLIGEVRSGLTSSVSGHSPIFLPRLRQPHSNPVSTSISYASGKDTIVSHYGPSAWQLERINVRPLHEMGLDATGVAIAFFDTGFRWRAIESERSRHVINEYDFVFRDSLTANEANDLPPQDSHGTGTMGTAAGFAPDSLVGPAYNADIYLAKTEDERSETPVEEDYYAEAVEWAEAQGVQLYSCSLGYVFFDSGFKSYTYQDLDGKTTISARATQRAVRLGMLPVVAMGNSGDKPFPYLTSPADADSILAVGALDVNDTIAGFSSRGPTSDGRIKPDVVAPGVYVWAPDVNGGYFGAGGTSFATPLVSGAAALIMQAHPEASAQAVRKAIIMTGDRTSHPDTAYGYGKINAYAAALQLGTIIAPPRVSVDSVIHLSIGIAANNRIKSASVRYRVKGESTEHVLALEQSPDSNIYQANFPALNGGTQIDYWIEAIDYADTITRLPRNSDSTFHLVFGKLAVHRSTPKKVIEGFGPNPANEFVNLQLNLDQSSRLQLHDALGREVQRQKLAGGQARVKLYVNSLPPGVYLLRISDNAGRALDVRRLTVVR
jgi:serine protease AprX